MEKRWQTSCPCEHCCKSSNICNYCNDWSEPINWKFKTSNPPNIRCNKCTNSYHQTCLPLDKRKANSWQTCSDIDKECSKYLDFFSFVDEMNNNNKEATKYENLIQQKYHEIYPNKKLNITTHFCGFHYNKWSYFIQDCAEILLNGEAPGICRIIDIFLTDQNESYVLIQWYQYCKKSEKELLLINGSDDNGIDVIKIDRINVKVAVLDTFEEYKFAVKKRNKLVREKTERINRQKNANPNHNICLFDKSIQFDKIFYSTQSCDNKKRMEIQHDILRQNRKQTENQNNRNRKRKRAFDDVTKIEQIQKTQKTKKRKVSRLVSREEYDELARANDKLKEEIIRSKKHEEEVLLLQKSNANYKNKIDCYEKNKQTLNTQLIELKKERDELYEAGRNKRARLREEHQNKIQELKKKIKESEKKNEKLEKTLQSKNDQINFYRKTRDADRNSNNKKNTKNTNNTNIPYHITPIDPRLNRQNSNTNQTM